jgi:hypothetical protein
MTTYDAIKARYAAARHPFFMGTYNLNVFGIRSNAKPNQFDDTIGVAYQDAYGVPHCETFAATTDPGTYWLQHPMRVEGTAVLALGHHRGIWMLGLHRGSYPALVQVGRCAVHRDDDGDEIVDPPDLEHVGLFGINLHRASRSGGSTLVDRWSAGCQVVQAPEALDRILELVERQRLAGRGTRCSYTLFSGE